MLASSRLLSLADAFRQRFSVVAKVKGGFRYLPSSIAKVTR